MKKFVGSLLGFVVISFSAQANDASCLPCSTSNEGLSKMAMNTILQSPTCLKRAGDESNEAIVEKNKLTDFELLARLTFAEGISTNMEKCAKYGASVYESIAWGVYSRVELAAKNPRYAQSFGKGYRGVIFKKAQFNPAVSKKSSYSKLFLCPTEHPKWKTYWQHATSAANKILVEGKKSPFTKAPTHFYYPQSSQATQPPVAWADLTKGKAQKAYLKGVKIDGNAFSNECVQFFAY
ncbi:hypothetical protein [Bdellovibrio bacteriovorus]|uniref:hypothetical protein n=1 Tax=Bdellovibrio bacteriovorus TaxID=959 RepID=UPI0035A73B81